MALQGLDRHLRRLHAIRSESASAANRALVAGAEMIRAEADRSISAGAVSDRNHGDTGELQAQLKTVNPRPLLAEVRSEAPYAAALEFGTSRMAARPYLRPARDKLAPQIARLFAEQINAVVRRSGR
jgi:HK97 gp10 family phage protein